MSLIEKIDEALKGVNTDRAAINNAQERDIWNNGYDNGMAQGLVMAKAFILSEQKPIGNTEQLKEPCHICQDTSNDRYYRNQGYKYCPHCGCSLDVTGTNVGKILTIGDKIRESNESLAEFALEVQSDTEHGEVWGTVERCEQYLNQPYTEK